MMPDSGTLTKLKPAAPRHVHLLLAAATWSLVGAMLGAFGLRWFLQGEVAEPALLLVAALAVGLAKALFILRKAASRVVGRIVKRGNGRCIGGFFSWRTWIAVAFMMALGQLLRASLLPPAILGLIYLAIGSSLIIASGFIWRAWRRDRASTRARAA